jgi:cytochrome c oxidase assembly factor CtaG
MLWSAPAGIARECDEMILVFVLLALGYMRGWLLVRSSSAHPVGAWPLTGFLLGLVSIWIAVASPFAGGDAHLLTVHMVQHLLLMSLAPPLIWLADPVRLLFCALPSWLTESVVLPIVRWRSIQRLGRLSGHPIVCWVAATTALVAWHVPALLTLSVHSTAWHAIEHASFLAGGLLFWWPVVQPWPSASTERPWSIILYLFLATLPCDVLSGFLVFSERIAYPMYLSGPQHMSVSVLEDQQRAGALMWTAVTIIYLVAGVIVATRSLSRSSCVNGRSTLPVGCDLRTGLVP